MITGMKIHIQIYESDRERATQLLHEFEHKNDNPSAQVSKQNIKPRFGLSNFLRFLFGLFFLVPMRKRTKTKD